MKLHHTCPFLTHDTDPLYLANGCFGGFQDLSATQMDLWSSSIGSRNLSDPDNPVLYPVTALHTAVWFRNAYYRERDFWVGRDGLVTLDPRYTADPAMPHLPQVYQCEQSLDLDTGIAECGGVLFPGSHAALEAGLTPERGIPYAVTTVFLKDSGLMMMEIRSDADTEILFAPEFCLEERFRLDVSGKGICKVGSDMECDFRLRKQMLEERAEGDSLVVRLQPEGGKPFAIRMDAPGAESREIMGRKGLCTKGTLTVFVQISTDDSELLSPPTRDDVLHMQRERWGDFWSRSRVTLPPSESLWQERYQASLFYVAQSIGEGPTHPGGLSKPNYPHWFGCFHDTDTYFCRPLLESGRPEGAGKHLRFRYRCLDRAREIAREHGKQGAQYPWQCDLNGNGGTHHSIMNAGIVAREAFFQSTMTGDPEAARMAGEIVEESFAYLLSFVEKVEGSWCLIADPLLTFSETMEVSQPTEAVLAIRAVALSVVQLRPESPLADTARAVLAELYPEECEDGTMAIAPDGDPEYMRCPSVTLGAFPLHVWPDELALSKSLEKELAKIVFVFAWLPHQLSATASMAGSCEGAASGAGILRLADAFYRQWHAVDEWENRRTGRADHFVTAAGGFATAVHHMLLAETQEGVWELFPGTPREWQDVAFEGLITRNGWRVSARLEKGKLVQVEAEAAHDSADEVLNLTCGIEGSDSVVRQSLPETFQMIFRRDCGTT